MKNSIKKSKVNNSRFNNFQNLAIATDQQKEVKGGDDTIIVEEVAIG